MRAESGPGEGTRFYDAVVIGAGFAGLYMLHKLLSIDMTAHAFESGSDVGGAWYWNRYPGARCDVESVLYSYSFSPELDREWKWSERFASQPEILNYLRFVAERLKLHPHISLGTRIVSASFEEERNLWRVESDSGRCTLATFLITAVGALSACNNPMIRGLERFKGERLHTAMWPQHRVSLEGKRVGVIGTGSSGVQVIQTVAPVVRELTIFQRTPAYSIPLPKESIGPSAKDEIKRELPRIRQLARRAIVFGCGDVLRREGEQCQLSASNLSRMTLEERNAVLKERWELGGVNPLLAFSDILRDPESNAALSGYVRARIRDLVIDDAVVRRISPHYPIGSKRICFDLGYYETFNRKNISLIDVLEDPIAEVVDAGIRLCSGRRMDLDVLIMATGFDAITGGLLKIEITGEGGASLKKHWENGPSTYLGLGIAGFPNLFTITGPMSPSALGIVVLNIEQHVEWISACIYKMRQRGLNRVVANHDAEAWWTNFVRESAVGSVYETTRSWYSGANIPGRSHGLLAFTGGLGKYRDICDQVQERGYCGFARTKVS